MRASPVDFLGAPLRKALDQAVALVKTKKDGLRSRIRAALKMQCTGVPGVLEGDLAKTRFKARRWVMCDQAHAINAAISAGFFESFEEPRWEGRAGSDGAAG